MAAFHKFLRLSRENRALLADAFALVLAVRIAQWILPWKVVVGTTKWLPLPMRSQVAIDRLVWAVRSSAARIPHATCLTKALALQRLLARSGYVASVEIGVTKNAGGNFEFHAWVEHQGEPLLERPDELAQYSRLLTVDAVSS